MKIFKMLFFLILIVASSAFLFACSTTETDNNVYCNRIALYHNNTEIIEREIDKNGTLNYTINLYSGDESYLIKYFMSPSNVSIGGVTVTGGDSKVASYVLNNVDKTITVTPNEEYDESNKTTFLSITSNDGTCNIVLKINFVHYLVNINQLIYPTSLLLFQL